MHKNHVMGFKDFTAFNLAMLGKQGWKLHTEPDSLVSRIFKARYFPSTSYLTSNLGHSPSYVWRSILRARFIVCGELDGVFAQVVRFLFSMNRGC